MSDEFLNQHEILLQVVTPSGLVEDTNVSIVTLAGTEGDFGVLPGHAPFFTVLKPGVIRYEEGGMPRALAVSGGFVDVTPEKITVLARTCEKRDQISVDRAEKALQAAEQKLSGIARDSDEWKRLEVKLARAIARIEVAKGDYGYGS